MGDKPSSRDGYALSRAHEMKVCTGRGKIPCVGLAETEREELIQAPDRDTLALEFSWREYSDVDIASPFERGTRTSRTNPRARRCWHSVRVDCAPVIAAERDSRARARSGVPYGVTAKGGSASLGPGFD